MSASLVLGLPKHIGEDDKNGILWLYKFYHENLPLEDCIFPEYELEKSPDGCRLKWPLIFEIRHTTEDIAAQVLQDDETIDVNAVDETGSTALFWAAKRGYYDLADRLATTSPLARFPNLALLTVDRIIEAVGLIHRNL